MLQYTRNQHHHYMTVQVSYQFATEVKETIEDMVEYLVSESVKNGQLISGETVYKMIESVAVAKQAEMQSQFDE